MDNSDIVTLVHTSRAPTSTDVKAKEQVDWADDVFEYLLHVPSASVEELGMNLKIPMPNLAHGLEKLQKGGYITIAPHLKLGRRFIEGPLRGITVPETEEGVGRGFHTRTGHFPHAAGGGYDVVEMSAKDVEVHLHPVDEEDEDE